MYFWNDQSKKPHSCTLSTLTVVQEYPAMTCILRLTQHHRDIKIISLLKNKRAGGVPRRGNGLAKMTSSIVPPAEPEFSALVPPRPEARTDSPVLHRLLRSRPNLFTVPLCLTHTAKFSSSSRGIQTRARTASIWQSPRNQCQLRCR